MILTSTQYAVLILFDPTSSHARRLALPPAAADLGFDLPVQASFAAASQTFRSFRIRLKSNNLVLVCFCLFLARIKPCNIFNPNPKGFHSALLTTTVEKTQAAACHLPPNPQNKTFGALGIGFPKDALQHGPASSHTTGTIFLQFRRQGFAVGCRCLKRPHDMECPTAQSFTKNFSYARTASRRLPSPACHF